MSTRVMSVIVPATNAQVVLFPNGAVHQTASPTDVWLGGGFLEWVEIANDATAALVGAMSIYDGLVNSTGRIVVGGTTTQDAHRVIASGVSVQETQFKEPYTLLAPNAEVTNLRKVMDGVKINVATSSRARFEIGQLLKGMAIYVTNTGGVAAFTLHVGYIPSASGWTRRRQFYRPGSTTKSQPAMQTTPAL